MLGSSKRTSVDAEVKEPDDGPEVVVGVKSLLLVVWARLQIDCDELLVT